MSWHHQIVYMLAALFTGAVITALCAIWIAGRAAGFPEMNSLSDNFDGTSLWCGIEAPRVVALPAAGFPFAVDAYRATAIHDLNGCSHLAIKRVWQPVGMVLDVLSWTVLSGAGLLLARAVRTA